MPSQVVPLQVARQGHPEVVPFNLRQLERAHPEDLEQVGPSQLPPAWLGPAPILELSLHLVLLKRSTAASGAHASPGKRG